MPESGKKLYILSVLSHSFEDRLEYQLKYQLLYSGIHIVHCLQLKRNPLKLNSQELLLRRSEVSPVLPVFFPGKHL